MLATKLKAKAKRQKRELPGGEFVALIGTPTGAATMRAIRDLGKLLVAERREFGMTPSSRARIVVADSERPQDFIDDAIFHQPVQLLVMPKPDHAESE